MTSVIAIFDFSGSRIPSVTDFPKKDSWNFLHYPITRRYKADEMNCLTFMRMIQEMNFQIQSNGMVYSIKIEGGNCNLSNVAEVIKEIIRLSDMNPVVIIEQLRGSYGQSETLKDDKPLLKSPFQNKSSVFHRAEEAPKEDRWIVIYNDGVFNTVRKAPNWKYIKDNFKFTHWAYVHELMEQEGLK